MTDYSTPKELPTGFRLFCTEKWYEHKDEILAWTGRPLTEYDSNYYFHKHRWMLKKMYQQQQIEQYACSHDREIQKAVKRGLKRGNF